MDEITKKEGRTILFVSHNMAAIQNLCNKSILMESGNIKMFDNTEKVIEFYTQKALGEKKTEIKDRVDRIGNGKLKVTGFKLLNEQGEETRYLTSGKDGAIVLEYELKDITLKKVDVTLGIDSFPSQNRIASISSKVLKKEIKVSNNLKYIKIRLPKLAFNAGQYQFTLFIEENAIIIDWVKGAGNFEVQAGHFYSSGKLPEQGNMLMEYDFIDNE